MTNVTKLTPRRFGAVEHPALGIVRINLVIETLSDGSEVYNVHLGNIVLHAIDADNATKLLDVLARAIDDHTVDATQVGWC